MFTFSKNPKTDSDARFIIAVVVILTENHFSYINVCTVLKHFTVNVWNKNYFGVSARNL